MTRGSTTGPAEMARRVVHRLRRAASNAAIDLRYGAWLGLRREAGKGVGVHNSDYEVLAQVFDGLIGPDDVLVDVGCSYGRVLNFWLHHGLGSRLVGIELDQGVASATARRLANHPNVEIIAGSAVDELPRDGTVFYLFNPFGPDVLERFAAEVRTLPANGARPLIVYYNCKHVDVFERNGDWTVERVALTSPDYAPASPLALITPR